MIRSDLLIPAQPQPGRLRFSVDNYYKLFGMGMIKDYAGCEIIDGEMMAKTAIGGKHALAVDLLTQLLVKTLSDSYSIRVQSPLRVSDFDEPNPDFVIADLSLYDGKSHPTPAETVLVIEVSDESLKFDRRMRRSMYAEVGIGEAWIVNLQHNVIEVHENPAFGLYQQVRIFRSGERVESLVLPELNFEADSIIS